MEGGDGLVGFVEGAGGDEDVVGFGGFEEGFDGFVADAAVGAGDEDDFGGGHGCLSMCSELGVREYLAAREEWAQVFCQ